MKRMLINATQAEELRVALVDGQKLYDLDIESAGREQRKANIYKGKITRIEPSLEAAFVDYGGERHGFLPLKEVAREYFPANFNQRGRPNIKEVLQEGQEVIVQIEKDERGNKGAALTTFISLAGCYLVLMPNNPRAGGISRRIEGEDRSDLKDVLNSLNVPDGMGMIVRTAGVGRGKSDLEADLERLLKLWTSITDAAGSRKAPFLVYAESDVITRAIRDCLRADIGEILVDTSSAFEKARQQVAWMQPDLVDRVKLYRDNIPLFNRFQIEVQIESAFQREVQLPSGGSIVIDPTEAMTCIDINSARATKGGDIEETALRTNVEAAEEIARQLRLRDIGGLIVIDFIDMTPARHQREVESALKEALKSDRARVQIGRLSRFGLLEMSRQRLRPSLEESSQIVCPRCNGQGTIRGVASLALSVLRLIEEAAMKDNTIQVLCSLPLEVATYLLNEKRTNIVSIEERLNVEVLILPNRHLETPHYQVQRIRDGEENENFVSYFHLDDEIVEEVTAHTTGQRHHHAHTHKTSQPAASAPAAVSITHTASPVKAAPAAAAPAPVKSEGLVGRLVRALFGSSPAPADTSTTTAPAPAAEIKEAPAARSRSASLSLLEQSTKAAASNNRQNNEQRNKKRRGGQNEFRQIREDGDELPDDSVNADTASATEKPQNQNSPRRRQERNPERGERNERSERNDKTERPERNRNERTERQAERSDRAERPERVESDERSTDKPERAERSERTDRPERGDRSERDRNRRNRPPRDEQAESQPTAAVTDDDAGKGEIEQNRKPRRRPRDEERPRRQPQTEQTVSPKPFEPTVDVASEPVTATPIELPAAVIAAVEAQDALQAAPVAAVAVEAPRPIEASTPAEPEAVPVQVAQVEASAAPSPALDVPAAPAPAAEAVPVTAEPVIDTPVVIEPQPEPVEIEQATETERLASFATAPATKPSRPPKREPRPAAPSVDPTPAPALVVSDAQSPATEGSASENLTVDRDPGFAMAPPAKPKLPPKRPKKELPVQDSAEVTVAVATPAVETAFETAEDVPQAEPGSQSFSPAAKPRAVRRVKAVEPTDLASDAPTLTPDPGKIDITE